MPSKKYSKEYLEGFVNSLKKIVPRHVLAKIHIYARSYAGGKRKGTAFLLQKDSEITYEEETETIKQNRETDEAKQEHVFLSADWTHKNGHPRCLQCGMEEPTSGMCEGYIAKQDEDHVHELPDGGFTGPAIERETGHIHKISDKETGPPINPGSKHTHTLPDGQKSSGPIDPEDAKERALKADDTELLDISADQLMILMAMGYEIEKQGTEVQSLIFDKKKFPKALNAVKWAKEHDFITDKVDEPEGGTTFRLRQIDPNKFNPNAFGKDQKFRIIQLDTGIKAVIGKPMIEKAIGDYTDDMKEFYEKRTKEHIDRVAENMNRMEGFDGLELKVLKERGKEHDASKYSSTEKEAYIWLTDMYRKKDKDPSYEGSGEFKNQIREATGHHIRNNLHHPESHKDINEMSRLDLAEMVSDWTAMAQEKGEAGGSAKGWADKIVGSKFKFNKENTSLIYQMIEFLDKANGTSEHLKKMKRIYKADKVKQIAYAVVLEPMTNVTSQGDSHGHRMTADEVMKTAHLWLSKYQIFDVRHDMKKIKAEPVESFIAPEDFKTPDGDKVLKGSWVVGVHVTDKKVWKEIENGKLNAFSPGGFGKLKPL